MGNVADINSLKNKRKCKKIIEELDQLIRVHDLTIQALKHFAKYATVMESISCLQSNKILLEIHLKKQRNILSSSQ